MTTTPTGRPKKYKKKVHELPADFFPLFTGTKEEKLHQLYDQWYGCTKCPLGEMRECEGRHDIVFGHGNPEADILIIGEAPGVEEEDTGIPFIGKSGQLLNQILAFTSADPLIRQWQEEYTRISHGARNVKRVQEYHNAIREWRYNEFFITNAVACKPDDLQTPTADQIKACWARLINTIYIVDPLLIVVCGNSALAATMRKVQTKITAARGKIYDVEFPGRVRPIVYPVLPVYHPSFLLRKADWNEPNGDYAKTVKDWRMGLKTVDFLRQRNYGTPIPERG